MVCVLFSYLHIVYTKSSFCTDKENTFFCHRYIKAVNVYFMQQLYLEKPYNCAYRRSCI